MSDYVIKEYRKGVEQDQARIGYKAAENWIWPYAYELDDILSIHARPDFDPETRHYCFLGEKMVGYMFSIITTAASNGACQAILDFPRMLPGHEYAADLLMKTAIETLKNKGVSNIVGRVTNMCPADIKLAEKFGFSIFDWGYKMYYSYEMVWGKLDLPSEEVVEIELEDSSDEYIEHAVRWFRQSPSWCKNLLAEWHEYGIIAHLGVLDQSKLTTSCLVTPNLVRPSTAGLYYIYAHDACSLRKMLGKVVHKCIAFGVQNVIADLVNEHRMYESIYQELGFKKVTEWANCEKVLT